jgi:hypothetical protein
VKKATVLQRAYGGDEEAFVLNLCNVELNGFGQNRDSLKDLLDASMAEIKE